MHWVPLESDVFCSDKDIGVWMDRVQMSNHGEILGAVTDRQIAGLRFFLSVAALIATSLEPVEPEAFFQLTYSALTIYTIYSALVYCLAHSLVTFSPVTNAIAISVDVLSYSVLVSMSSGTNSIFFFFYFFVIVAACSRLGAEAGISITFVSTLLFVSLAYYSTPQATQEWNHIALRPLSLVTLGYVLTYWARAEEALRRRLDLLR